MRRFEDEVVKARTEDMVNAIKPIVDVLAPLSDEERQRVLRTVAAYFGFRI